MEWGASNYPPQQPHTPWLLLTLIHTHTPTLYYTIIHHPITPHNTILHNTAPHTHTKDYTHCTTLTPHTTSLNHTPRTQNYPTLPPSPPRVQTPSIRAMKEKGSEKEENKRTDLEKGNPTNKETKRNSQERTKEKKLGSLFHQKWNRLVKLMLN